MKIIVCCKVVPNEEEIVVSTDRTLNLSAASWKISQYDLNALESAKQLALQTGGSVTALSVGGSAALEPTKIRKDILSRGADELKLVIDDSRTFADSLETAKTLAAAIRAIGEYDIVLCGMGSSDLYLQEVGIQVGALLGLPVTNAICAIHTTDGQRLEVERALEDALEILDVPLPAVLCVSSEINLPSIPAMRDIMKAGKKPADALNVDNTDADASVRTVDQLAPEQQERRQQIVEGDGAEAVAALVQFLKKEGF